MGLYDGRKVHHRSDNQNGGVKVAGFLPEPSGTCVQKRIKGEKGGEGGKKIGYLEPHVCN